MRRVMAMGVALVLAGCGLMGKDEHGYPEAVKRNFLKSCTAHAPEAACQCTLAGIEQAIAYDRFAAQDAAMKAGTPDPAFVRQVEGIVLQCRQGG